MKSVLTIVGYDPTSGAGITADMKVFGAHGLFGTSAITALTVQSTIGVESVHPVETSILRATLECLHRDMTPAGIKIGMLATAGQVETVCGYLEMTRAANARRATPVVLDPVLRSSSGRELLDPDGLHLMKTRLLPLVDWVTPNLEELSILSGAPAGERKEVPSAVRQLCENILTRQPGLGLGVFATGGHLEPPDDFVSGPDGVEVWLEGLRLETRATHGTGCALSSAFLSGLVIGHSATKAAAHAKAYVREAMQHEVPIGSGARCMNHLWAYPEVLL
ncbi:MAG: bifunctional hydroxymethylpyrimidine kinase/phosphomethylpyrimidine kinase [Acidobacteriaceae bacterium]